MLRRLAAWAGLWLCGLVSATAGELAPFADLGSTASRYSAVGYASWYGQDFHGRATADGETFDMRAISAAHPSLPLPCYARVTNLANGRSIVVRVNDRGPYARGRILDVSARVASLLNFGSRGVAKVRIDYMGMARPAGSDAAALLASLNTGRAAPSVLSYAAAERTPPPQRPVIAEGYSLAARSVENAAPAATRSPYGELIAYPFLAAPPPVHSPYGELVAWKAPMDAP